jgi:hypothetical protein
MEPLTLEQKIDTLLEQNEIILDNLEAVQEELQELREAISNISLPGSDYGVESYETD